MQKQSTFTPFWATQAFFLKKEATIQRSLNLNAKNEKKSNEPILRKKGITGGLTDRTDRRPDRTDIQTNGRTAE